jgi:HK97 family phage portal protein
MTTSPRQGTFRSLLRKLGFEKKDGTGTLSQPDDWLFELLSGNIEPTIAGVTVTPINAMEVSAVRCAVQAIAETVAQLPLEIIESDDNNAKTARADHPAAKLLGPRGNPNPWTPPSLLIERVTRDALLRRWGGFAEIVRNSDGVPIELHHIDQLFTEVEPRWLEGVTEPSYFVTGPKEQSRTISYADMLHIPSPSQWGVLHDAKNAIALAMVLERHGLTLFGKGARPGGVLTFPTKLDAATSARMKASWQAAHGGSFNGGGTAILEEGAKWEALAFSSTDSQYIELRKFCVEEIARHFRCPPTFLMDYGRATWSNSEGMEGAFLTFTVVPWLKRWEDEISLKLFGDSERAHLTAAFNTNSLARSDFLNRMQGYQSAISSRVLNPNEARAWENLPPYDGGDKFSNPNVDPVKPPNVREAA